MQHYLVIYNLTTVCMYMYAHMYSSIMYNMLRLSFANEIWDSYIVYGHNILEYVSSGHVTLKSACRLELTFLHRVSMLEH